jgi:hypothetical protein
MNLAELALVGLKMVLQLVAGGVAVAFEAHLQIQNQLRVDYYLNVTSWTTLTIPSAWIFRPLQRQLQLCSLRYNHQLHRGRSHPALLLMKMEVQILVWAHGNNRLPHPYYYFLPIH